ncbi:MAG TPA: gliding motility lipoprotein GldH [Prolixibacteraceae bacterium]|nr:gliding motility lipoprotein GldH [Prolixibacteraceae bacterium]
MNIHSKYKFAIAILGGVMLMLFVSCQQRSVYQEYQTVDSNGWHADSVLSFNFEIEDTTETYRILFNNRNLDSYPYQNIWLFVEIMAPDSSLVFDTIEYQLARPNGKWVGEGTSGVYDTRLIYRDNVYFPLSGSYTFDVKHGMRNNKLKGISDFGLSVEKREE